MGQGSMTDAQTAIANDLPDAVSYGWPGNPEMCPICGFPGTADFLSAPDRFHWRREMYQLRRCSSCLHVWLDHPPQPDEMAPHYDEDYHKTIAAGGEGSANKRWSRPRSIIERYSRGGSLLDIGCSSGGFLGTLKGGAWKLYGIEMEQSTAERARAASGAEVFVGDIESAPFAKASFDVITCFDLLEHVYQPREFLRRVQGWMKPGGIVITQLPNIRSWEARLFGTYWYGLELPRHLSHFSPESLRHLMKDLGFQEVSVATPPVSYIERSLGFVAAALIEMLGGTPAPQSKLRPRSIFSRVIRKAARVLALNPFAQLAAAVGEGPSIEGIFRKQNSDERNETVESR